MRREFPKRVMRDAFVRADGQCEACGARLTVGKFAYDHIIPDALGGEPTLENCQCVCLPCHGAKTQKIDVPMIAKAKRNYDKHRGIKKPSRFPGSRNSRFKKKIDGSVVLRSGMFRS